MLLLALAAGAAFYAEYSVLQAPLYSWRHFKNRDIVSSLGRVVLRNGRTDIYSSDGDRLWQSDKEWRVQDVLVFDVDRDGLEEIAYHKNQLSAVRSCQSSAVLLFSAA